MSDSYINNPIPGRIIRTMLLTLTKRNRDSKVEMINTRQEKRGRSSDQYNNKYTGKIKRTIK